MWSYKICKLIGVLIFCYLLSIFDNIGSRRLCKFQNYFLFIYFTSSNFSVKREKGDNAHDVTQQRTQRCNTMSRYIFFSFLSRRSISRVSPDDTSAARFSSTAFVRRREKQQTRPCQDPRWYNRFASIIKVLPHRHRKSRDGGRWRAVVSCPVVEAVAAKQRKRARGRAH